MPNWCENKMIVAGRADVVKSFVERMGDELKMLESHIPTPQFLLNSHAETEEQRQKNMDDYGAPDWYWWRVHNWGTKWDIDDAYITDEADDFHKDGHTISSFVMYFNTAWAPPEDGILTISSMYENLFFHLEFEEPGMAFEGYYRCMNGKVLGAETRDMNEKFEWINESIYDYWESAVIDTENDDNKETNV